jgi:hypothetical protein
MGGPSTPSETGPFLQRLFQDRDIIELPGGRACTCLAPGLFIPSHPHTAAVLPPLQKSGTGNVAWRGCACGVVVVGCPPLSAPS